MIFLFFLSKHKGCSTIFLSIFIDILIDLFICFLTKFCMNFIDLQYMFIDVLLICYWFAIDLLVGFVVVWGFASSSWGRFRRRWGVGFVVVGGVGWLNFDWCLNDFLLISDECLIEFWLDLECVLIWF